MKICKLDVLDLSCRIVINEHGLANQNICGAFDQKWKHKSDVLKTFWHLPQRKLCSHAFPTDVFNELRHALKIDGLLQVFHDDHHYNNDDDGNGDSDDDDDDNED